MNNQTQPPAAGEAAHTPTLPVFMVNGYPVRSMTAASAKRHAELYHPAVKFGPLSARKARPATQEETDTFLQREYFNQTRSHLYPESK